MGKCFDLLPVEERVQQYREMADATFLKSKTTQNPVLRGQLMNMATSWHALAQQLEAGNLDPELGPVAPQDANAQEEPQQA